MAISKVSDFAVGDIDLTAMMSTLNHAYKGQARVTISEYDTDSAPVVKVGSVFDCNGAQYAVNTADETPTGYSGISNSTTFYLYFDESAEAFIYSETAPTWSDDLQGWYNGNDRALFSMYKDSGGTLYQYKNIITNDKIRSRRYKIGSWDMDTNLIFYIDRDLPVTDIIEMSAIIYTDTEIEAYPFVNLDSTASNNVTGKIDAVHTTKDVYRLLIPSGGFFNSTNFNDASINRGYLNIKYMGTKP